MPKVTRVLESSIEIQLNLHHQVRSRNQKILHRKTKNSIDESSSQNDVDEPSTVENSSEKPPSSENWEGNNALVLDSEDGKERNKH